MIDAIGGMNSSALGFINQIFRQPNPDPFKDADQNQDGILEKSEALSFLENVAKKTGKPIDGEQIFAQLDLNGDGKIDPVEFKAGREKLMKMMGPPPAMKGMRKNDFSDFLLQMLNQEDEQKANQSTLANDQTAPTSLFQYLKNESNSNDPNNSLNILA